MPHTATGSALISLAKSVGYVDYEVHRGDARADKVWRMRAANGRPICFQVNNKEPRIWVLPQHTASIPATIGKREYYEAGRGRHSNLQQIREFVGQPLVKVVLSETRFEAIRDALTAFGAAAAA